MRDTRTLWTVDVQFGGAASVEVFAVDPADAQEQAKRAVETFHPETPRIPGQPWVSSVELDGVQVVGTYGQED